MRSKTEFGLGIMMVLALVQLTACEDSEPEQDPPTAASGTSSGGSAEPGAGGTPGATGGASPEATGGASPGTGGSAALGGSAGAGDPGAIPLFPWAEGNTWTYKVTDELGAVSTKINSVGAQEAVGVGPHQDELAYKATALKDDGTDKTESWQVVIGTRLVRYRELAYSASTGQPNGDVYWDPEKLRVDWSPDRTAAGAEWTETYTEYEDQMDGNGFVGTSVTETWRVEGVDQTVTVPAGTFDNAVLVVRTSGGSEKQYWFVPGIGKVKETGGQTEELVSYEVSE